MIEREGIDRLTRENLVRFGLVVLTTLSFGIALYLGEKNFTEERERCITQGIIDDQGNRGINFELDRGCERFMPEYQKKKLKFNGYGVMHW